MNEVEKEAKVQEIFKTYAENGSMAHSIISVELQLLSKYDEELASKTLKTLEKRGF